MKKKNDLKRIDKIWTTGKRMQSFNTCNKSSSDTWVYFSYIYFECHQSHLSSKKFNLFFAIYIFLKMGLSYKHIKIITQLKNSIEKSNNKHIFVVKFKHVDITYFNNQKKKSTNCPFTEKTTISLVEVIHAENMDFKVFLQHSGKKS